MSDRILMNLMKLILPAFVLVGLGGCSVGNGSDQSKVYGFRDEALMEATDISDFDYLAVYVVDGSPDRGIPNHLETNLVHDGNGYIFKITAEGQWLTCFLLNNNQEILIEYDLGQVIDDLSNPENGYQVRDEYPSLDREYTHQETWDDITMKLVFFSATVDYNYSPPSYSLTFAVLLDYG